MYDNPETLANQKGLTKPYVQTYQKLSKMVASLERDEPVEKRLNESEVKDIAAIVTLHNHIPYEFKSLETMVAENKSQYQSIMQNDEYDQLTSAIYNKDVLELICMLTMDEIEHQEDAQELGERLLSNICEHYLREYAILDSLSKKAQIVDLSDTGIPKEEQQYFTKQLAQKSQLNEMQFRFAYLGYLMAIELEDDFHEVIEEALQMKQILVKPKKENKR